ncbi:CDP-alcohol phosphatidyltransferase family protein [Eleftheria terrae]|uniref:CDP-alcohol phosphatidyltransferase family protein n=1 Tax=Eleftheria terrae TaxID=1597781 RepID=UPI00263BA019|nr:CDP-alcohol phosphatidyltransferase family protein [Eleftheria terrae]WKB51850.1 CDP-alcohol phosphatidyltransferase family protein [Eleftheria terrae]
MFADTVPGTPPAPLRAASPTPSAGDPLRQELRRDLLVTAALLAPLAFGIAWLAKLGPGYAGKALALLALAGVLLWRGLPAHRPHRRLGAANRVTLARLALVTLLAAGLGEPIHGRPALDWALVALAGVAALLDGLDGPLARASGLSSEFGARFDMETDTLLMLVLALLAVQSGRAGAWLLAAGLLRHAFVAAARLWPWLAAPLPPSRRRKAVCALQIGCLVACLAPLFDATAAAAMAGAGLLALCASFAADVAWLARRRHLHRETAA